MTGEAGTAAEGPWAQALRLAFGFLFAAVLVAAGAWAVSNVARVPPDSRAVVLRFGSPVREQGPGLLIAWPRPVEQVVFLPSADQQIEMRISRFESAANAAPATLPVPGAPVEAPSFGLSDDPRENAGFLLTGDRSVVHLDASIFYRITDPAAYLVERDHVAAALQRTAIAAAISVSAGRDLDSILVAHPDEGQAASDADAEGRERLRADIVRAIDTRLDALAAQGAGLGVTVDRVDLAAAIPAGAKEAFDLVLVATQAAERGIADARTQAETAAQGADQEADRIRADAEADAEEQVRQAQASTAAIAALTDEMAGTDGSMLLTRVYNDRMAALLSKIGHVELVDPADSGRTILPGAVPH